MLPAYEDILKINNFKQIAKIDQNYANIIAAEYNYCLKHESEIRQKAQSVYKIGYNKNHRLNYTCCDFQKLEQEYMNYKNINTN